MSATAGQIDAALFAALSSLVPNAGPPTTNQPFAAALRITEPLSKDNVDAWAEGQWPCALLYCAGARDDNDAETLGGGPFETRERVRWTVYVGVADPRDEGSAITGATGVPGALGLKAAVCAVCNGLDVPAPAAVATLRVKGAVGMTDAIDPLARIVFTMNGVDYAFALSDTSVTYDALTGYATVTGTCVSPPGSLGNLPLGLPGGGGTWNAYQPTHAINVPVMVTAMTPGAYGTLRNRFVLLREWAPALQSRGAYVVLALQFEAEASAEQWTAPDESRTLSSIHGNVNSVDTANTVSTQMDQFIADPTA